MLLMELCDFEYDMNIHKLFVWGKYVVVIDAVMLFNRLRYCYSIIVLPEMILVFIVLQWSSHIDKICDQNLKHKGDQQRY